MIRERDALLSEMKFIILMGSLADSKTVFIQKLCFPFELVSPTFGAQCCEIKLISSNMEFSLKLI